MTHEPVERLVPAWLTALGVAAGLAALAVAGFGTHPVDPSVLRYESVEHGAREPSPPPPAPDAPRAEHLDYWTRELARVRRRLQRRRALIEQLDRLDERTRSGALPQQGLERLEVRARELDRALESDQAEIEALERRLEALRSGAPVAGAG